jgi:hypothetical protein
MAESGAVLHEVGLQTARALADYEHAINERTRLLLRVHPSNFRITGFAEKPGLENWLRLASEPAFRLKILARAVWWISPRGESPNHSFGKA